ncbi:MAG: LicD family protein [Methanosphaera sp.]|nr:LicD family protein [Methanosphaera sp.]
MNHQIKEIKLKMLNEFQKQVDNIVQKYEAKKINFSELNYNIVRIMGAWNVSRMDIKNIGVNTNDIKLISDINNLDVTYPNWLKKENGNGCKIESKNDFQIDFICINEGKINVSLKGMDFRDINKERVPVLINYIDVEINGKKVINGNKLVWHDASHGFSQKCADKEIKKIKISFKTIHDYYPELKEILNKLVDNESDFKANQNQLDKFLETEKALLRNVPLQSNNGSASSESIDFLNRRIDEMLSDNEKLIKEFNKYKKETNKILDSYNILFNNMYVYHELKPKKIVRLSRELNMQLLDFIDNICKKYEFNWWLYGGTLLGAIRHNGFIPWDDDCDINMLREDYEQFLKVIPKEATICGLDKNIVARTDTITNNNTYLPFIKLEYRVKGKLYAFVDIFPVDYTSKLIDNIEEVFVNEHKRLRHDLREGADREVVLQRALNKLNVSKTKTDTLITGVETTASYFSIFSYDTIFPLKSIKFEDRNYPCPNDYITYTKMAYGNSYNKVPKSVYDHGFYDFLSGHENVYENFENEINKINEVNKNFENN